MPWQANETPKPPLRKAAVRCGEASDERIGLPKQHSFLELVR